MFKQSQILFIGPYSKKPKGGIAFVLSEYEKIFPDAYFVSSTISKNKFAKIFGFVLGITRFVFFLMACPKIKIVHIHGASYSSFTRKYIIYRVAKWLNKTVVYHIHGAEYQLFYKTAKVKTQRRIQCLINNVDCLVCLSESWKAFFSEFFNPNRIEIIPNIIAQPLTTKTPSKLNSRPLKFILLGFIDQRKGIWLLLETLQLIKNNLLDKVVFYIGGNGETKLLEQRINEYGLTDIVKYVGWVGGEEKQKLLSSADVYILPSYNEGLPISILEAMSYSLPILSTTVGGIPEIVNSSNGVLIEPGNKEMLREGIEFFVNAGKSVLERMGEASLNKVKPHLPLKVRSALIDLYNSL